MGKSKNRVISFRQFSVHDDQCAMKVGSDALILGAWTPIQSDSHVLDIGTGSGLLALMAAQRATEGHVTAIELDAKAATQAKENFQRSPFSDRMQLIHGDYLEWCKNQDQTWDVVLCNPPFFRDKPKSPDGSRNLARHDDSLRIEDLFATLQSLTHDLSRFAIVWPTDRRVDLERAAAANGWHEAERLEVHGTTDHACERHVSLWVQFPSQPTRVTEFFLETEVFTESKAPDHTAQYKKLLAPFMERYASFESRS